MRAAKEVVNPNLLKPKNQIPCKLDQKGDSKIGDRCDFSHGTGSAAPAMCSAKKDRRKEKWSRKKAAKAAAAVETGAGPSAAGPTPLSDSS